METDWDNTFSPTPCPSCGYRRLRPSRYVSVGERARAWWTRTVPFRCRSCNWRGLLPDVWVAPAHADPEAGANGSVDLDAPGLAEHLTAPPPPPEAGAALAESKGAIKLWLDDQRPAPNGWVQITTVDAAKHLLAQGIVEEASLDHDLGWCDDCASRLHELKVAVRDQCPHVPSGYDLCVWMAETGHWPKVPPNVHSGNLEGAARMRGIIQRHWQPPGAVPATGDEAGAAEQAAARGRSARAMTVEVDAVEQGLRAATLTRCPKCGEPTLYRRHRRSRWEVVRSWVLETYPVRCEKCQWDGWMKGPIMVQLTTRGGRDASRSRRSRHDHARER